MYCVAGLLCRRHSGPVASHWLRLRRHARLQRSVWQCEQPLTYHFTGHVQLCTKQPKCARWIKRTRVAFQGLLFVERWRRASSAFTSFCERTPKECLCWRLNCRRPGERGRSCLSNTNYKGHCRLTEPDMKYEPCRAGLGLCQEYRTACYCSLGPF